MGCRNGSRVGCRARTRTASPALTHTEQMAKLGRHERRIAPRRGLRHRRGAPRRLPLAGSGRAHSLRGQVRAPPVAPPLVLPGRHRQDGPSGGRCRVGPVGLRAQRIRRAPARNALDPGVAARVQRPAQARPPLRVHQDHPRARPASGSGHARPQRRRPATTAPSAAPGGWPGRSTSCPWRPVFGTVPPTPPSTSPTSSSCSPAVAPRTACAPKPAPVPPPAPAAAPPPSTAAACAPPAPFSKPAAARRWKSLQCC